MPASHAACSPSSSNITLFMLHRRSGSRVIFYWLGVCLLPVTEVHWELRTRTASAAFPQGLSPLQWKRFKYFGSCMSWQFGPEAHKSLTNIQFPITPGATGCGADHHIKHGRTMWKRVFQLKLTTCQGNKYPSDLSAAGDLDAASEDTLSRSRMRMLSSAALACHAQPTKVKPSEGNPARMTGGARYPFCCQHPPDMLNAVEGWGPPTHPCHPNI